MNNREATNMGASEVMDLVPVGDKEQAIREAAESPPGAAAQELAPQYSRGFDGVATGAFPQTAIEVIQAPLERNLVEVKPDGIVYLPWVHFNARLNKAFGPGAHALVPRGPARTMGNLVTYHGALYILGRFVSEAVGECNYIPSNSSMSYASALEGAKSDCLTRCCKTLGIGMEMWDPSWRESWLAEFCLKSWVVPKDSRYKPKWFYWRRDREIPWQVAEGGERPVPARDLPAGQDIPTTGAAPAAAEPAKPVSKAAPKRGAKEAPRSEAPKHATATTASGAIGRPSTGASTASSSPSVGVDTGEAASDEDIEALGELVTELRWPKPRVSGFFRKYFQLMPEEFTKAQMKDCFSLLYAYQSGEEPYRQKIAELQKAGRIGGVEAA